MAKRNNNEIVSNRVLVCDDDVNLIEEYKRCLGQDYIEEVGATTLTDLEKVLFGDESGESGATMVAVSNVVWQPAKMRWTALVAAMEPSWSCTRVSNLK